MQSEKPRVLGIEGGGTKTEWALVEDGRVVQSGLLPQGNLRLNTDEQLAQLFSALPHDVTHVGAYLAACGTTEDRTRLRALVSASWPGAHISVGADRDSAIATAFEEADGIVVIAGTGAVVHGRHNERVEKAGGWGHVFGDRGGGYDLARQALRLVLTRFDIDHTITPLGARILRELALNSLQELGAWAMGADKMSIARLAPAVFDAVRHGEREMLAVLEEGAGVLAEFTRAVSKRIDWPEPDVRLFGGLFAKHDDYVALFKIRLSVLLPGARVEVCRKSGALGAAWLAHRHAIKDEAIKEGRAGDTADIARAATEQGNERSARLDEMSPAEIVELFVSEEEYVTKALGALSEELTRAVQVVGDAMSEGGRLFYVGAGTSGRLGVLDASEIPPTFGASPELVQGIIAGGATAIHRAVEGAEDQPDAGALAVLQRGVRSGDVVCGIAASGRTPFVLGALARARGLGAKTILITCNPERAPSDWDVEVDLPTGPEIVTGSTRLKAGTATKVALNILSTAAMVRLGKVKGNRMIDVGISNEKLRDRGARIVAETLSIPYEKARNRLQAAGWNVRACIDAARED